MYRASIASIIMQNIEEIAFIEDISDIALHGASPSMEDSRR